MSLCRAGGVRVAFVAMACLALLACSSTDKPTPTPLEPFTAKLGGGQVWQRNVGAPAANLRVASAEGLVVLSTRDGQVVSFDAATGAERSRVQIGTPLSAGVGSDGRLSAVVTRDNDLVVVDATRELWRKRLRTSVVTPPLVAGERVFVQGVDRVVEAYDGADGRKLWAFSRPSDPLALSQPGLLMALKDTLLVGVGARLVSLDPLLGVVRGDVALAAPRGANEVERLADLVGPAARLGDAVCARAFQAAVACVNAERQTLQWSRPVGGFQGVAADADYVYAADSTDRMTAWRRASGDTVWSSERLRHRGLSAPLVLPNAVLYGDVEGQIHVLSRDKGESLQRWSTDSSGVAAPMVRNGTTVVAVTRSGGVYGFRAD